MGNSGENIYPEVIETLLSGYPLVEEALVIQKDNQLQALIYRATGLKIQNCRRNWSRSAWI